MTTTPYDPAAFDAAQTEFAEQEMLRMQHECEMTNAEIAAVTALVSNEAWATVKALAMTARNDVNLFPQRDLARAVDALVSMIEVVEAQQCSIYRDMAEAIAEPMAEPAPEPAPEPDPAA